MSHVLHLFDRAAQLLSAEGGGASSSKLETAGGASSRRRLDFGPSPSLEPPAPSAIEPPSSASSRPSVPRGLKAQPDSRLDHHRAAVLGQRLLAAELRGCERHAALVPELMQLVEEASRVSLSSSLAHAASQPELQVVIHVMQRELQAVELRHHPLPAELAERYEAQEQAHAQALKEEREASARQALQAEQQVAELGEELDRLKSEHEAVLDELLLRGKCEAASARASAAQLEARLRDEGRAALELARAELHAEREARAADVARLELEGRAALELARAELQVEREARAAEVERSAAREAQLRSSAATMLETQRAEAAAAAAQVATNPSPNHPTLTTLP